MLGVTAVLLLIFLSNRMVQYLADAAAGEIPTNMILTLVLLKSIKYLILLMPLALYLAVLLVQGRMYRDNEMAAMSACGVSCLQLYKPVYLIAIPISLLLAWLSFIAVPWTADIEYRILSEAEKKLEITGITAGRFNESRDGTRIIFVESMSEDKRNMRNVFIQVRQKTRTVVLSSQKAHIETDRKTGARYLVLVEGYRYDGVPGQVDYRITRFTRHGFLIKRPTRVDGIKRKTASLSTETLLAMNTPAARAELHWRLSVPVAALVLALLSLPMGKTSPRKGRYGRLFVSVLVYIFYVNLLAVGQSWIERGKVPDIVGLWWVHALAIILAIVIMVRQQGVRWVFRKRGQEKGT